MQVTNVGSPELPPYGTVNKKIMTRTNTAVSEVIDG